MATGLMRREQPDHSLQPSALVNEALIRLFDGNVLARAQDRRYLFAAAAQAMRQVLVDHARQRNAAKRAAADERVPLDQVLLAYFEGPKARRYRPPRGPRPVNDAQPARKGWWSRSDSSPACRCRR